jgi:hypothetical protein
VTRGRRLALVAIAVACALGAAAWAIASPYRWFPSDDASYLAERAAWAHRPLFLGSLSLLQLGWSRFSDSASWLLAHTLLSYVVVITTLALLAGRAFDDRPGAAIAAAVVFGTAAWPVTYLFFGCQAPMAAALTIGSFAISYEASRAESPRRAARLFVVSGAVAGALQGVTASAPVEVLSLAGSVAVLVGTRRRPIGWPALVRFGAGAAVIGGGIALASWDALLVHLSADLDAVHRRDALRVLGVAPETPVPSFLRISFAYAPILFAGILLSLGLSRSLRERPAAGRAVVASLAFVVTHAALVDLLPFTKLGRTHFPAFPLFVFAGFVPAWHVATSRRAPIRIGLALLFVGAAAQGLVVSARTVRARSAVPRFVASHPDADLCAFEADPHARYVESWLNHALRRVESAREAPSSDRQSILLVGPHGLGSGRSVLHHATLPDFHFHLDGARPRTRAVLPFYGFLPAFAFEEENTEGLYFAGRLPDPDLPRFQMTAYVW